MPRSKRQNSSTGYYHIMIRGNNKQKIFLDNSDYKVFLRMVHRQLKKRQISIICYCLMPNHVHFLLFDKLYDSESIQNKKPKSVINSTNELSSFMRCLNSAYAVYFNSKYQRIGKLCQDRFKSEAVEDESYLLTVFRYILQNPREAKLSSTLDYQWSSYSEIFGQRLTTNPQFIINLLGGVNSTLGFLKADNEDKVMDIQDDRPRLNSREMLKLYNKAYTNICATSDAACNNFLQINNSNDIRGKHWRNLLIANLHSEGLNKNEIASLLGVSRSTVYRALEQSASPNSQ